MWPRQSQCDAFYGNPRGPHNKCSRTWERNNLIYVTSPWTMYFAGEKLGRFKIHSKCAASLLRVMLASWDAIGRDQAEADRRGWSVFSGAFNFRSKRGSAGLSMHAYGIAVDFDASNNGFGDTSFKFTPDDPLVAAFEKEGWVWGGRWKKPDAMHFQAAIVG